MGVGIRLTNVCGPAITVCAKACISYITVTVPAPNILAVEIFGTDIFHRHIVP